MVRPSTRPWSLALVTIVSVMAVAAQQGRVVRIEPENPAPGAVFIVTVELTDVQAGRVVAVEPVVVGSALYTGSDIKPGPVSGGQPTTMVAYRFVAGAPGRIEIRNLAVTVGTRAIKLGTWSVDIVGATQAPVIRHGTWRLPDSVWNREAFVATAMGPDGNPVICPTFAVPGAVVQPVDGRPGSFMVVSMDSGTISLPAMTLHDGRGDFELDARHVRIRALPAGASAAAAVGGSWRLELMAPRPDSIAAPGTVMSWELRAYGTGLFGFANSPRISVAGPGEVRVDVSGGPMFTGTRGNERYIGARGSLSLGSVGVYTIEPQPYPWFDTLTATIRYARAPSVKIRVVAESSPAWTPTVEDRQLARKAVAHARGTTWDAVVLAAAKDAWPAAHDAASVAAGVGRARGALAAARLQPGESLAAAATSLMAGDRAEAYGMLLRLQKSAFPPPEASALVSIAAASFGNLPPPPYVLPPLGLPLALGIVSMALAAAWYGIRVALVRSWNIPRAPMAALVLGVVLLALAGASALERRGQRIVALGGVGRSVPSETSAGGFPLKPGKTGRVLQSADVWLLVELDGGGLAWITRGDAVVY